MRAQRAHGGGVGTLANMILGIPFVGIYAVPWALLGTGRTQAANSSLNVITRIVCRDVCLMTVAPKTHIYNLPQIPDDRLTLDGFVLKYNQVCILVTMILDIQEVGVGRSHGLGTLLAGIVVACIIVADLFLWVADSKFNIYSFQELVLAQASDNDAL
jgi:hypothetical protein